MLPPSFNLLEQEGYLISSCLTTGLTELRSANVHNKGAFYSALFNLSIGMERLLKAIIIMEHMLNNSLTTPTKRQLKSYGHNIIELYEICVKIGKLRGVNTPPPLSSHAQAAREIMNLLNEFAQSARYHNLDALSKSQTGVDPLSQWSSVLLNVLVSDVSKSQQEKIFTRAKLIAQNIDDITLTIMHDLDQNPMSTEQALAMPGLHDQAVKHIVLHIIKVLSPLRELISDISHAAYGLGEGTPPFPQMQEFLEWIWDDRQYVLRKKKWP